MKESTSRVEKSLKNPSKSSKRIVTFEKEAGGAIRHAKLKEPVTSEKILQALDFNTRGGSIRKARKKESKRDKKLEQALASHRGGGGLNSTTNNTSICTRTFPEGVEDSTLQCVEKWCIA